jgi:excisionase family DNA binding protein
LSSSSPASPRASSCIAKSLAAGEISDRDSGALRPARRRDRIANAVLSVPFEPVHSLPFRERPTCSINEACAATGLGRTTLYALIKKERVAATKVGRKTLVVVATLLAAVGA